MLRFFFVFVCAAFAAGARVAWTPALSMQVRAIDDVIPSPYGKLVLWVARRAVMDPEHSEFVTQISLAPTDGTKNAVFLAKVIDDLQLTLVHPPADGDQHEPEWIQDSRHLVSSLS